MNESKIVLINNKFYNDIASAINNVKRYAGVLNWQYFSYHPSEMPSEIRNLKSENITQKYFSYPLCYSLLDFLTFFGYNQDKYDAIFIEGDAMFIGQLIPATLSYKNASPFYCFLHLTSESLPLQSLTTTNVGYSAKCIIDNRLSGTRSVHANTMYDMAPHCISIASRASNVASTAYKLVQGSYTSVETIAQYAFKNCVTLLSIDMGSNVKTIGSQAFMNCYQLSGELDLRNVTSINSDAFKNCGKLLRIILGSVPPAIQNASIFNGANNLLLYMIPPLGLTKDAYMASAAWANILQQFGSRCILYWV